MKYCGIGRTRPVVRAVTCSNVFNANGLPYQSLGDQILQSVHYGADINNSAVVQYDEDTVDEVDVLTDANHDFFDISEQFGEQVATPAPPPQKSEEPKSE